MIIKLRLFFDDGNSLELEVFSPESEVYSLKSKSRHLK